MPRGYLKRRQSVVGKKRGRGGSSQRSPNKGGWGRPNSKAPTRLARIPEDYDSLWWGDDDLFYRYFGYSLFDQDREEEAGYDDVESYGRGGAGVPLQRETPEESTDKLESSSSTRSFIAVSEAESYSLCGDDDFVVDDESTFSLISGFHDIDSAETECDRFVVVGDDNCDSCTSFRSLPSEGEAKQADPFARTADHPSPPPLCFICYEEKPLIKLMKKCSHPAACYDCLRHHYHVDLDEGTKSYPLMCFWPNCDRVLREEQVRKFAKNEQEMTDYYYELKAHARNLKRQEEEARKGVRNLMRAYTESKVCPYCYTTGNMVRPYCDNFNKKRGAMMSTMMVTCKNAKCSRAFPIHPGLRPGEVRSVLMALGASAASCPVCGLFFSKEGGCDHMNCVACGANFSFEQAAYFPDK